MQNRITAMTLATALTTALAAGPALAGNLAEPMVEPAIQAAPAPMVPAGPNWTGFYGGVQLGYADVDTDASGVKGDGAIGGLVLGYDYDFGNWVLGAGLDYDFASIELTPGVKLENVMRLKTRAGAKLGNGLLYGTAGWAKADTDNLGDQTGWFAGAGYEHLVGQNLAVGGEVLYHEFDDFDGSGIDVNATTAQVRVTWRF